MCVCVCVCVLVGEVDATKGNVFLASVLIHDKGFLAVGCAIYRQHKDRGDEVEHSPTLLFLLLLLWCECCHGGSIGYVG